MEDKLLFDQPAKVRISNNELEISGPVDFVKDQIEKMDGLVKAFIEKIKENKMPTDKKSLSMPTQPLLIEEASESKTKVEEFAEFEEVAKNSFDTYKNIISVINGRLQVLVPIPGNNLANKMVNLITIYLWVRLQQKIELVTFAELRSVSELHGQLDKTHFANYIKNNKRIFIVEGEGKKLLARLTVPGILEAEKLLSLMNTPKNKL